VDTRESSATQRTNQEVRVFAAACEAMRFLQSRQAHTPEQMLDPRETRVLKQLRSAVRGAMDERR
jgi:hypothetical protein